MELACGMGDGLRGRGDRIIFICDDDDDDFGCCCWGEMGRKLKGGVSFE